MNKFPNQFETSLIFFIFFIDSIKDIAVKSWKWIVISYRVRDIYILSFQEARKWIVEKISPPPWRKINLEKQAAITDGPKIKQNKTTLVSETCKR